MPLHILIGLVVVGIVGIAVLTWAFGLSTPLRFADEAQARAAWLRHWPEDRVAAVHIAPDGAAALIETDRGAGVVFAMGADSTGHRLDGAEIRETPTGLRIHFHDFATPRLDVTLPPGARARWRETLSEAV
ncbi:hypothetical protein DZD18_15155 [Rhodobacteraceae bacterium W635]|uniref:hypothetical protein n=1 Tax=Nioella halotolerans TaxID=2303578 RepID=UPI000E3E8304|nr:hypothetical protein DZD18_15155 [Rhodobacteraceae bacterium W635]